MSPSASEGCVNAIPLITVNPRLKMSPKITVPCLSLSCHNNQSTSLTDSQRRWGKVIKRLFSTKPKERRTSMTFAKGEEEEKRDVERQHRSLGKRKGALRRTKGTNRDFGSSCKPLFLLLTPRYSRPWALLLWLQGKWQTKKREIHIRAGGLPDSAHNQILAPARRIEAMSGFG